MEFLGGNLGENQHGGLELGARHDLTQNDLLQQANDNSPPTMT